MILTVVNYWTKFILWSTYSSSYILAKFDVQLLAIKMTFCLHCLYTVAWLKFYKSAQINSPSSKYSDILPTWRMPPKLGGHTLTKKIPAHQDFGFYSNKGKNFMVAKFYKNQFFEWFLHAELIIWWVTMISYQKNAKNQFFWKSHIFQCTIELCSKFSDGWGFFLWGCGLLIWMAFFKLVKCLITMS